MKGWNGGKEKGKEEEGRKKGQEVGGLFKLKKKKVTYRRKFRNGLRRLVEL